jgi:hypothetical protein
MHIYEGATALLIGTKVDRVNALILEFLVGLGDERALHVRVNQF